MPFWPLFPFVLAGKDQSHHVTLLLVVLPPPDTDRLRVYTKIEQLRNPGQITTHIYLKTPSLMIVAYAIYQCSFSEGVRLFLFAVSGQHS